MREMSLHFIDHESREYVGGALTPVSVIGKPQLFQLALFDTVKRMNSVDKYSADVFSERFGRRQIGQIRVFIIVEQVNYFI